MVDSNKVVRYGRNEFVQHEEAADGAVTAGFLLERTANGVAAHSTAAGDINTPLVAKDLRQAGFTLGDEYSDGVDVPYLACSGGGAHLMLATANDVAAGDRLVSAGDGSVRAYDSANDAAAAVVATADEDLNNTSGSPSAIAVDF